MNKETASYGMDSAVQGLGANIANKSRSSKTSRILAHLISGASITPIEALALYGSLRLSSIIFRLKAKGYEISTTIIKAGESRVACYSIKQVEEARVKYFTENSLTL